MIRILAAISLLLTAVASKPIPEDRSIPPTMDLSAVRYLVCKNSQGFYTGSGFLIAPHILATARHVADGDKCMDVETRTIVKPYHLDAYHDFALMAAPGLPDNIPFVRYRCDGIKAKQTYLSYGITDYRQEVPILRMNVIKASDEIVKIDDEVYDFPHSKGMRVFDGAIAPGMSGGPVIDLQGYAVAVNNAGDGKQTLLYDLKDTVLCK